MKKLLVLFAVLLTFALVAPAADEPRKPGASPAPTPRPPLGAAAGTRHLTLRIRVDGMDNFTVLNGRLSIEHQSWDKPSNILVNGVAWQPRWDGNHSEEFARFNPSLAPFTGTKVSFRKMRGRGSANILEAPTAANGQRLRFQIDDAPPSGAENYEVQITW